MENNKRYKQDLMDELEEICSRDGEVNLVGEEFYKWFINFTDEQLKVIIRIIVAATYKTINGGVLSGRWSGEEDIYFHIMMMLELIAEGKFAFRIDEDRNLPEIVVFKAIGSPPSHDMWALIQNKIENSRPITRDVMLKILGVEQGHQADAPTGPADG